jgi:hypothetical protein
MRFYIDASRENDPHALPDAEVYQVDERGYVDGEPRESILSRLVRQHEEPGWYWWTCFPGCLPDEEPMGPFATEAEAIADARGE